jgi:caspase domain-containing protein
MRTMVVSVAAALVLCTAARAWCAGPVQRYALVVGANSGGPDRPTLHYAISDAEHFARVMVELGGVTTGHEIVLRQPKLRELIDAFDLLTRYVDEGRRLGGRTEVVVYYSGHADETGLLFGGDRYSYGTLRERLAQIPADVRIAILDACSSGAFTRVKSGKPRPPFMVDEASDMRGHAFLTSSSESEAAQESDRIRASYFTHYLLSGFRGAADLSGDGKVTLNEAYQFAFNETLGRTIDTKGGAQHPSYDISMSGTGDVVMTDVHQTNATLVLGEELDGRLFVRTAAQELVVELYKPRGRRVELAVEPGKYDIRLERDKESLTARAEVATDARVVLEPTQFGLAPPPEPTRRRGDGRSPFAVAGRHRLEFRTGTWPKADTGARISNGSNGRDLFAGVSYSKYLREDLAAVVSVDAFEIDSGTMLGPTGVGSGTVGGSAINVGVRWNPFARIFGAQALKPFVGAGLGPVIGISNGSFISGRGISTGSTVRATLGGFVGGGLDVHAARSIAVGVTAGYAAMSNFSEPVGLRDNFNGPQVAISLGWIFGKGW